MPFFAEARLYLDRAAWVRIAPFAVFVALLALSGLWPLHDSRQILSPWWYSLRTAATASLLALYWREYAELRAGTPPGAGAPAADPGDAVAHAAKTLPPPATGLSASRCWGEAIAVGLAVWLMWIWTGPMLQLPGVHPSEAPWPDEPAAAILWLVLRFAGAVVVVPLMEELFWRSYLMRRIDAPAFLSLSPKQVSWFAMILSSAVFATAHRELLAAFLCGLAYAAFYRRHGQLRYVVGAHAATNMALGIYVVWSQRWEFW